MYSSDEYQIYYDIMSFIQDNLYVHSFSEELLDAGIIYRNKKEQLDSIIGDGYRHGVTYTR